MLENKINIEPQDNLAEAKSYHPDKLNLKMSTHNLNFYYGENQALFDVSLDIEKMLLN